jgi:hypothetical protein
VAPITLTIWNGFWLILPAIIWNVIFAPRLTAPGFTDDSAVPQAILWPELVLRILLFATPILLALKLPLSKPWLTALVLGYVLYFASWLPHLMAPDGRLAQNPLIIIGPAITPLIWLMAIAALTGSRLYAAAGLVFIVVHVTHQFYSFELV